MPIPFSDAEAEIGSVDDVDCLANFLFSTS